MPRYALGAEGRGFESPVAHIAQAIKQNQCAGSDPIIIGFYLPGMTVDEGSWANAQYDSEMYGPNIRTQITGLKPETVAAFLNRKLDPGEELIARGEDPVVGCVSTILRKNGKYYEELSSDPSVTAGKGIELRVSDTPKGRKFKWTESPTGDYVILTRDGQLREYDNDGYIKTLIPLHK